MNWTTEFPTKPGWYWIRNIRVKGAASHALSWWRERRIIYLGYDLDIAFVGTDSIQRRELVESAEWYGPLEPPE